MPNDEIRSQEWVDKIETLVRRAESLPDPHARQITIDLLRAVLDFHAAGLERMLEITFDSGAAGQAIIDRLADDDLTSSLLLLHDLHPDDVETRLQRAVEKLEQMFSSLGARLSIGSFDGRTVTVLFESSRTWSAAAVRTSVEKSILQAAPEIESIAIEGIKEIPAADFVPVAQLLAGLPA